MNHTTMSNKINIAEILKDCPKGMKLFSLIEGEVTFNGINDNNDEYPILILDTFKRQKSYTKEGFLTKGYPNAECVLFPSSKMRDWSHFFKRGDIITDSSIISLVEGWADSDYYLFKPRFSVVADGRIFAPIECSYKSQHYHLASKEQQKYFIERIEAFYKGKYNPKTLQVEPIKPECEFKPFDQVLVRDGKEGEKWKIGLFSHYDWTSEFVYVSLGHKGWKYCIPYNEQTAHLLNTTDPYNK